MFRIDRFMAGWYLDKMPGETEPETPYTMVDSGHDCSWGERDFRAEFRKMIDAEMERPPLAIINASRERPDPSTLVVKAQVTNISTATLQTSSNMATLHVMVYEGHRALQTGRIVHANRTENFNDPLKPGATRYYEFTFDNLKGVNMSLLDAVVMVDYVPDPITGRWDMLNAAVAQSAPLPPTPTPYPTSTSTPLPTRTPTSVPTEAPTLTPTPEPFHMEVFLPLAMRRHHLIR
jgi:hypothetical protein